MVERKKERGKEGRGKERKKRVGGRERGTDIKALPSGGLEQISWQYHLRVSVSTGAQSFSC